MTELESKPSQSPFICPLRAGRGCEAATDKISPRACIPIKDLYTGEVLAGTCGVRDNPSGQEFCYNDYLIRIRNVR